MGVRYPRRAERLRRLRAELAEIVPRLIDDHTEKVILFGSAARGCVGSTSDLDLLIVRRDSRPTAARMDDLYRRARPRVAVDILVYTPQEIEQGVAASSLVRRALRDGEVLYDRSRAVV